MWQYISMKSRDSIAATVGSNIRTLRLDRSLTLAGLAEQAGTSVRTLVEIESGRANASLATLGAIADALGVAFGRLTQPQEPGAVRTVRTADAAVTWSDDRGSEARLMLVSREPQSAELWHWLLKPGGRYQARPDPDGTDVLVLVIRGALAMTVDDETSHLAAGTAGHIVSGTGYVLANPGRAEAAFMLVHVPPAGTRARYTTAAANAASTS
jgi:transcriptional regulator with XRE-family HTH domain